MNRGKSYRILSVILIFAFVSLISRSIIYLVISLTIAVLIIVLLSRDVKERERLKKNNNEMGRSISNKSGHQSAVSTSTSTMIFPILLFIVGAILVIFGFNGYFEVEGVFHRLGWMENEHFVFLVFLIGGIVLSLYGFTTILKKWLS
ncbi:hypothetical protein ACM26V_01960 [Salipaludibacillus sp. HK11]|uniref:hypothetical protein n=1 Tax=Salipaludibacillus sp. HK11 TaxID=3394320 RepID=UPI0039FD1260